MICTVALLRHGGSHLIRPIVAGLGYDKIIEPGKKGAPIDKAEGPVIVFLRDPRDRMVSTFRYWSRKAGKSKKMLAGTGSDNPDAQLAWLIGKAEGGGFMPDMLRWARIWCAWPEALSVRFEDVRENGPAEVARIAKHMGLPEDPARDDALFSGIYGDGPTYTGHHSDWRESFGALASGAWERNGGPELLRIMGYA